MGARGKFRGGGILMRVRVRVRILFGLSRWRTRSVELAVDGFKDEAAEVHGVRENKKIKGEKWMR